MEKLLLLMDKDNHIARNKYSDQELHIMPSTINLVGDKTILNDPWDE